MDEGRDDEGVEVTDSWMEEGGVVIEGPRTGTGKK